MGGRAGARGEPAEFAAELPLPHQREPVRLRGGKGSGRGRQEGSERSVFQGVRAQEFLFDFLIHPCPSEGEVAYFMMRGASAVHHNPEGASGHFMTREPMHHNPRCFRPFHEEEADAPQSEVIRAI